jgi:hypothetical protein
VGAPQHACAHKDGADIPAVTAPETSPEESGPSQISKNVFRLMVAIVIVLALVAIYANVQRLRRARMETATFTPATTITTTPSPAPTSNR